MLTRLLSPQHTLQCDMVHIYVWLRACAEMSFCPADRVFASNMLGQVFFWGGGEGCYK
jgi:hypothetical protein